MSKNDGATKQDLKELETNIRREVREVMGEYTQEILGALSPEIQSIKADIVDLKATTTRIENKLDATANKVNDHEVRIGRLEHQAV